MAPRSRIGASLLLALCVAAPLAAHAYTAQGFIKACGTRFCDEACRDYIPTGWNTWPNPLLRYAIDATKPSPKQAWSEEQLDGVFARAAAAGFNTVRIFGHGVDKGDPADSYDDGFILQNSPGNYNEDTFAGLDKVLATAEKYGIRVIFSITSNWQKRDGILSYAEWAGVPPDGFWTSDAAKTLYKNHLAALANRRNTITNKLYKDDPTIFAWNLYNEPRCPYAQAQGSLEGCWSTVGNWIGEMAATLKRLDPNHMVTVGEEGFYRAGSGHDDDNPFGTPSNVYPGWAGHVGQDFTSHHSSGDIDFAAFHAWVDNWNSRDVDWYSRWLNAHRRTAEELGKPVLLEEYGKRAAPGESPAQRDPYFAATHNAVEESLATGGALRGSLFWYWDMFGGEKCPPGPEASLPSECNVVKSDDSSFGLLTAHNARIAAAHGQPIPGCTGKASAVAGKRLF